MLLAAASVLVDALEESRERETRGGEGAAGGGDGAKLRGNGAAVVVVAELDDVGRRHGDVVVDGDGDGNGNGTSTKRESHAQWKLCAVPGVVRLQPPSKCDVTDAGCGWTCLHPNEHDAYRDQLQRACQAQTQTQTQRGDEGGCCTCPLGTYLVDAERGCAPLCPHDVETDDPSRCDSPYSRATPTTQFLTTEPTNVRIEHVRVGPAPCLADDDPSSIVIHFSVARVWDGAQLNNAESTECAPPDASASKQPLEPDYFVWFAASPVYSTAFVTRAFKVGCLGFKKEKTTFYAARLRMRPVGDAHSLVAYEIGVLGNADARRTRPAQRITSVAPPPGSVRPQQFIVVGDTDMKGVPRLAPIMSRFVREQPHSAMLFVGDATYATNSGSCYGAAFNVDPASECGYECVAPKCSFHGTHEWVLQKGYNWFRAMEGSVAGRIPWAQSPGNHDTDAAWVFTFHAPGIAADTPNVVEAVASRRNVTGAGATATATAPKKPKRRIFLTPSDTPDKVQGIIDLLREPMFYSFDWGLVHVVYIGSEDNPINAYERWDGQPLSVGMRDRFAAKYGPESPQYQWLANDLRAASEPSRRALVPWIVLITHRPMYHTASHHPMCRPGGDWFGCLFRDTYEPLLLKHKVDMVFSGHSHHYSRSHPMARDRRVDAGGAGVVHCIVGTGGYSPTGNAWASTPDWVAHRDGTRFGFAAFEALNATHLTWKYVAAPHDGSVGDKFDVVDEAVVVRSSA